jgi:hypothetical protein
MSIQEPERAWFLDKKEKPPEGGFDQATGRSAVAGLFDLGFLELDVLLRNRVVLLERELFRLRAAVLARHVEVAGVGGGKKLDLDVRSFGHFWVLP